jgi:flagellar protein FlbD
MKSRVAMLKLRTKDRTCRFSRHVHRKAAVIFLTRLNGTKFYINPELIQTVEETPDTVITLINNKKIIVKDTPQEIAERFIEYRRRTLAPFGSQKPS